VAFLIEAQGRYAKISGFDGSEKFSHEVSGWPTTSETKGTLFYVGGEKYPGLTFLSDGASGGQNIRKAVLDLSGISLLAGLGFRF